MFKDENNVKKDGSEDYIKMQGDFSLLLHNKILLLDVTGVLAAYLSLAFIVIPSPKRVNTDNRLWRDIKEWFSIIGSTTGLPTLFAGFTLVTFVEMLVAVLFPLITIDHFERNTFQMGLIEMV